MKRQAIGALLATGIALSISAATALPATAATSGSETFSGTIVISGVSGTRTVINSVVVAKGVFSGVGQVVEIPGLPGDPDNVSRDDLVFPEGIMHLVSTTVNLSLTRLTPGCLANATLQQTAVIDGGTGEFAAATGSFTATVGGPALFPRNPDGSCAFTVALHEEDMFTDSGTLSF